LPLPIVHGKLEPAMRIQIQWGAVLVPFFSIICHSAFAEEFLPFPADSSIVLAATADGVQIYESKPNPSGGFQWSLKAPEAELKNVSGEILGKHGAGPSWTLNDGSSIVASLPPLKNLASSKSVPWLLLAVKSKSGSGILEKVDYVVRVATEGGAAPADPPQAEGQIVKVKYQAIYLFLHKA
jgi:Protein of unknown function (DUF3455)